MNEKPLVTVTDLKSKGKKYVISFMGQTVSRISKREYSHIIIGIIYNGNLVDFNYCGRHDLALKKLTELEKEFETYNTKPTHVQIVEVKGDLK